MYRRKLLSMAALSAAGGAGGCLGSTQENRPEIVLDGVFTTNGRSEEVDVEFEIERNGEVVHEEVVTSSPKRYDDDGNLIFGGSAVECSWAESPAVYTVRGKFPDSDEWKVHTFENASRGECYRGYYTVGSELFPGQHDKGCQGDFKEDCGFE